VTRGPRPSVIALAGPNGVGKSTVGADLLHGALQVTAFVNADVIAQGLSVFDPAAVAIAAGRVMRARLRELAARRANFAFETTLAGRTHATWLRSLIRTGYEFHLAFLWLSSADLAVARVRSRVELGGHSVPERTIRRRYAAGLRNLFTVYTPMATTWRLHDNSGTTGPRLIAEGRGSESPSVRDRAIWTRISEEWTQ
jgi:predicted ABC-type ATPase